ncbi:prepilin-type N-terminal cleavage/methylation domain-containing protein [Opitutales bacterium]|nr:prepilin-type N-terminal cleavage/methylation domain-containing protein [Opitutales bacterium]
MNDLPSRHPGNRRNCGFTLLEVIIALSVFGFLIGGLLALLPWGVEGAGNVRDRNVAYGMTDAIQVELELMGFGLVESLTDEDRIIELVAPSDGREVRWEPNSNQISEFPIAKSQLDELDKELPAGQRYFLIRCSQFPEDNRHEHDPSNGYLGLQIDVQWPYKTLDAEDGVEERIRSHFHFPLAITR